MVDTLESEIIDRNILLFSVSFHAYIEIFLLFKTLFPPPFFYVIFNRILMSFTFTVRPKVQYRELTSELLVVCVKINRK
jgi:hypothetical protein